MRIWQRVWWVFWLVTGVCTAALGAHPLLPEREAQARKKLGSVTWLHEDNAGFLWIGTRNGLLSYDGYNYRLFDHDLADERSISGNTIRTIYEDRQGRLWLGTNSAGLNLLDRGRWGFRAYRHDSSDRTSISHDSVNVIMQDHAGQIWVGTQIGLNRFDPETGVFERVMSVPGDPRSLSSDYVYDLYEDSKGDIWVGTIGGGLNRWNREDGTFTHYQVDREDPRSLVDDDVFVITEDEQGFLWLGTGRGVCRMDPKTGVFTPVRLPSAPLPGTETDPITAILKGPDGRIWIGAWRGQISVADPDADPMVVRQVPFAGDDLEASRILSMLFDRQGALWVGTWESGLQRIQASQESFRVTGPRSSDGKPLDATSVHEDREGRLWVGIWGGGLARRTHEQEPEDRFEIAIEELNPLKIIEDRKGRLWAGSMANLHRYDPRTREVEQYRHDPADERSLGKGYQYAVYEDSDGRIWVGVGGSGLYRLLEDGSGFERFAHDSSDPASLSDDYITALLEDAEGRLWVGTRSGGLNLMDRATGEVVRCLPDPADPRSLGHHSVTAIAIDSAGTLWVGTDGGGLHRLDEIDAQKGPRFSRLTEGSGLVSDSVVSLAADGDDLWIGTREGLSRYSPLHSRFASYDVTDGLPSAQFNQGAAEVGREKIYMGTARGLLEIPRGTPMLTPSASPVLLTALRNLQGPILGDEPPWQRKQVTLDYGELLSFEMSVLDYGESRRHRYAYRLEGISDEWVDLEFRREVTFTDLEPGLYTLTIKGMNARGVWSEPSAPLAIRVVPPFWMTWWFRGAMLLALVGLAYGAHKRRTSVLRRRNEELLALQRQREQVHERLRRLSVRLEAAREDERKRIARELHDEMGQALTATKINLQVLAASGEKNPSSIARIDDAIGLLDRMIQHVRALSLDLRPPLLDELGLLPALKGYLEARAHRTGLKIRVEADPLPGPLGAHLEIAIFRVIQEAVTNVIRHAEAREVLVSLLLQEDDLEITVSDEGKGFDVEQALGRSLQGHHLGLLGMRERVEGLGGDVSIESVLGSGTTLRFVIPLAENVLQAASDRDH